MLIDIGTRLGSHEITSLLGRGGVGEVYRALDTRLNRPVAIKFLSDDLADANARRRFQREAQTASSLNHPHIVTVYDIGEHEGKQYIVTEFVDGGTLKDWAKAEKRTWKQIVELVIGVADGLAAAHQAGILHRDIKPANVLVAKNGYAKLADFGLAKLVEDGPLSEEALTVDGTRPGVVVGTVAYMSPEQASGRPLDVRSDIFSFGVLLHELLSGRLPFGGSTDLEILKTIIHGLPEPLGPEVPAALRGTVEKALEKDPTERYQSMRDFVVDLRRSIRQTTTEAPVITAKPRRRSIRIVAAVAGSLIAIAVAAGFWLARRPAPVPENLLADATFTRLTDFPGDETGAALSPDGKFVVFLSDRDGRPNLWINQVGTNGFRNLTNSAFLANPRGGRPAGFTFDGSQIWLAGPPPPSARLSLLPLVGGSPQPFLPDKATNVSWSPDGKRLVYLVNTPGDPLFVADGDGSSPQQIFVDSEGLHNHFPTWSADGKWIYFAHGQVVSFQFDLWRIEATGGKPEQLTHHNGFVGYPTPIDARTILYVAEDQNGGPWLWAFNAESKSSRRVTSGVDRYYSIAGSADTRRFVAAVANPVASLWSVPILDHTADAAEIKTYNLPTTRALAPRFAGGALYYLSSLDSGDGLWRFKDGQASEIWKASEGTASEPAAISPDGLQIAVVLRRNGKQSLRLMKSDGSEMRPFAETLAVRGSPTWSPDGKWIATGGNDGTDDGLFKIPVEGGPPVRLAKGLAFNPIWSPNEPLIVYAGPNVAAEQSLLAVRPDGSAVDFPAIKTYGEGALARFSPDGRNLIYVGRTEALVDFRLTDLASKKSRSLAHIENPTTVRSFDIAPDGKQIVFDRLRINSDIVLIDLPKK